MGGVLALPPLIYLGTYVGPGLGPMQDTSLLEQGGTRRQIVTLHWELEFRIAQ